MGSLSPGGTTSISASSLLKWPGTADHSGEALQSEGAPVRREGEILVRMNEPKKGWHADPFLPGRWHYWDGAQWNGIRQEQGEHVSGHFRLNARQARWRKRRSWRRLVLRHRLVELLRSRT